MHLFGRDNNGRRRGAMSILSIMGAIGIASPDEPREVAT
jgi:hypothetical protein